MPAPSSSRNRFVRVLQEADLPGQALAVADMGTLVDALRAVPDPRARRGVRHSLLSVLVLAVAAVMGGARSYTAIADWARDHHETHPALLTGAGIGVPHRATIGRVLRAVDPLALEGPVGGWARARAARLAARPARPLVPDRERRRVLSLDGKTLRGSHDTARGADAVKLLAVYDHHADLVIAQVPIIDANEITAYTTALETLPDLHGCVVTADALHTQRAHASYLLGRGAHYLMTIKANQPALHRALRALPWEGLTSTGERDASHGRRESRHVRAITLNTGQRSLFEGAAQALRIRRQRTATTRRPGNGKPTTTTTVETVYVLTSLSPTQAHPALIASWIRSHWRIENSVHHVRDVTYREDASRIRTGNGAHVMATLRNTALNLIRLHRDDPTESIARSNRRYDHHPHTTLAVLHAA